jgi:uncharacterized protein YciI
MRTLYVLIVEFSEPAGAVLAKGRDDFAGHRAHMSAFHARGTLVMSGAFQDPGKPLVTMGIFLKRAAAEEFAREDALVFKGLAIKWSVREWHEVLTA